VKQFKIKKIKNMSKKIVIIALILNSYISFSQTEVKPKVNTKSDNQKSKTLKYKTLKSENLKSKSLKTETSKPETVKSEPIKTEIVNPELVKTETIKTENTIKEIVNTDCEYFRTVSNDKETYKATKLSLVYLKDYAGNIDRIYFSLIKKNGISSLNVDFMYKDDEDELFKNRCFNKTSKIEFILKNGVVIKLLLVEDENCLKIDKYNENSKKQSASLSGSFRFLLENISSLKDSPIASMEVFFAKGSQDYIFQKSVFLESDNLNYEPANYFVKYLNCIDN
jgi:hypothetical protein